MQRTTWTRWAAAVFAVAVLGLSAQSSHAALVQILTPDAAYTSSTTLIPITADDFDPVSSLSDATLTIDIAPTTEAGTVPSGGWASWSSPPDSESATPRVLKTNGVNSVTLTFSELLSTFGVEVEPNNFAPYNFSATFFNGLTDVGTIGRNSVEGDSGARLLAATSDTPFDSVVITVEAGAEGFAMAQFRYALGDTPPPPSVPEPGTMALAGIGVLAGLGAAWRRRRAA